MRGGGHHAKKIATDHHARTLSAMADTARAGYAGTMQDGKKAPFALAPQDAWPRSPAERTRARLCLRVLRYLDGATADAADEADNGSGPL